MNTNIPRIEFPELYFGFVAPIGADLPAALKAFKAYFQEANYRVIEIKATDVFKILNKYVPPKQELKSFPTHDRYHSFIQYGDQLREEFRDDSFLAVTTVASIMREREKLTDDQKFNKTVYLLHQFKRREEVELLRAVYGEAFFQVSLYSRRGARVENLARKFASGQSSSNINAFKAQAELLVQTDENENNNDHGQRVGKIFHSADFIVSLDQHSPNADEQVKRFLDLVFSSNKLSPSKMEHGMFLAKGAALRSLDLSRQVGACILDDTGQIMSLGANEVPKAEGGTYWSGEEFDDRDFIRGIDTNQKHKIEILGELLRALKITRPVEEVLADAEVRDTQLMDALEYSRVIHAEMNAISDAARSGRPIQAATLYCTTFPCHLCAKHIVASGLKQVVFLEPYPKSLAFQLHSDSLQVEEGDRGKYARFPAVQFMHFYGVTPRRYQELFERGKRKDDHGSFVEYRHNKRQPLIDMKSPYYTIAEGVVLAALKRMYQAHFVDEEALNGGG